MRTIKSTCVVGSITAVAILSIAAGCSKPSEETLSSISGPTPASVQGNDAPNVKTASKLGDLSSFRAIAEDAAARLDNGDPAGGKSRMEDLKTAWDAAEAGLRSRAPDDWRVVDRAIDQALSPLRASPPDADECKLVIEDLLKTMDGINEK